MRKKTENALADAQRVIADKEALLQDARVTATQHQNAHMDTKRDRDGLQAALTQTQQALDVEVAAKADLQTLANQLKEKLAFQQQLHEKVHCINCAEKIFVRLVHGFTHNWIVYACFFGWASLLVDKGIVTLNLVTIYRKIPKKIPGAYIFKGPFWGAFGGAYLG